MFLTPLYVNTNLLTVYTPYQKCGERVYEEHLALYEEQPAQDH
jgi:hypothetical protein